MSIAGEASGHAALMDGVYRYQRHIYDLTRKYYLLGRDELIASLDVPAGGEVLELGCGTGRNLIAAARRYPKARLVGIDISAEMLATARRRIEAAGLSDRIRVFKGDATAFDPASLTDRGGFDRVMVSYSVSMIPAWEQALAAGTDALKRGGSLHVVDFGGQKGLPAWFRTALNAWLARFHVTPRGDLDIILAMLALEGRGRLEWRSRFRDYAVLGIVRLPR